MKKQLFICLLLVVLTSISQASITPVDLRCENLKDPLVVDILKPRLSWVNICHNEERGQLQTAWEIRVATTRNKILVGDIDLWSSGKVMSDNSINIPYDGKSLVSREECWWQVRVWDKNGEVSPWSDPGSWSMGLLTTGEWTAQWIGAPWQGEEPLLRPSSPGGDSGQVFRHPGSENTPPPAPMLRKKFTVTKEIAAAHAFVSGLGFFEFYVNGEKAGKDVLAPNLTLYGKREDPGPIGVMTGNNFREYRVMYLAYDIKDLLHEGENAIGAILGNGFYNPGYYWTQGYGTPRFIGQIYITYTDGTEQLIESDKTWKTSKSPVLMDLVYDGEHYDARLEQAGWCTSSFNDSGWEQAAQKRSPEGVMKAQMSPPDRVMESLVPIKIEKIGQGHYRADFGQEISGWLHLINMSGERGQKIEIKYICESPVGDNSYIMKGDTSESYATRFSWYVFREVEITNWPGELKPDQIRAEAVYSDVETTGKFECSNKLFNTINRIWWRSQTDNMHGGIASDCPHRERSPYTGDGQVACATVMDNFDARTFYTKWIRDIFGAQNPETGYVPNGAPWQPGCGGGVAWGAAMNIMPWEYFLHYGDYDLLRENFEGMKGYIKYMLTWTDDDGIMFSQAPDKNNPNQWINLGDWVAPDKLPPAPMVHTFYLWNCATLTAAAAKALGLPEEELTYGRLAEKTRVAFQKRFYDSSKGSYGPYGGNIFALKMGLPDDQKTLVIKSLEAEIHANGDHLDTGIFGTRYLFEVLAKNGLNELAFKIMNQRTKPSYGWWIDQGATTTWEEWGGSGSRNHPMFGGGLSWFYNSLAGMNSDSEKPGYKHIIFWPRPAGDITSASYFNLTPYGNAGIYWKKEANTFLMDITVPVGCSATVHVPASSSDKVKEQGKGTKLSRDLTFIRMENGYALFEVASGSYHFKSDIK